MCEGRGEVKGLSPLMTDFTITACSYMVAPLMDKIRPLIAATGDMDDVQYASLQSSCFKDLVLTVSKQ